MWRKRKQEDFQAEIEAHLQLEIDRLRAEGLSPADAEAAARRAFGNSALVEERFYETSRFMWLENFFRDLGYALRLMRKNRAFSATIIAVLALGAGANTAVFSVVNAVLLKAVPYDRPGELVRLFQQPQGKTRMPVAPANYLDWQQQARSFESMAAFQTQTYQVERSDQVTKVAGARVSAGLFATLTVDAALGRVFLPQEDKPGAPPVVVLSHSLWTTAFGADPNIIDQQVRLNNRSVTVIGIMPPGFAFPSEQSVIWTPLMLGDTKRSLSRTENYLGVVARFKPGVGFSQAQADLDAIAQRLATAHPQSNERLGFALRSLREHTVGNVESALLVLLAAVVFVLLIAGANVSNLLLARTADRRREIAVRVSLGASRARILWQLLVESMLLGLVGGAAGWLLAQTSFQLLLQLVPDTVPGVTRIQLDYQVFLFTAAVSLIAGVMFGLAPALDASRTQLTDGLQQGGRSSAGRRTARLRDGLVALEVSLALILLVGSGLMIRTMANLYGVDPGFNPDRLLTIPVSFHLPPVGEDEPQQPAEAREAVAFRELIARAAALPGVRSVGAISSLPLTDEYTSTRLMVEGRPLPATEAVPRVDYSIITPSYFQMMEIPLRSGRVFTDADGLKAPPVAMINAAMARQFFPGENPIGRRIRRGGRDSTLPWVQIVGVVGDVRHVGLDTPPVPELFFPHAQVAWPQLHLFVRTIADPSTMAAPLRRLVREMGPANDTGTPRTAEQLAASSVGTRRFAMQLLALLALLAFTLAGVGIYGVLSYTVAQRRREIGIRMALGATASAIVRTVVARGAVPLAMGITAGIACSLGLVRLMQSLLYGVTAYDAVAFLAAVGLLILIAVAALWSPARHASRTDPLIALRHE